MSGLANTQWSEQPKPASIAETDNILGLVSDVNALIEISALRTRLNTGNQVFTGGITVGSHITMPNGGTIGQGAGPLIRFDSSNKILGILGGKVGIGTANPRSLLSNTSTDLSTVADNTTGLVWLNNVSAKAAATFKNTNATNPICAAFVLSLFTPADGDVYCTFRDGGLAEEGRIDGDGSGGVNYQSISDVRAKENPIDYIDNALSIVKQIRVIKYGSEDEGLIGFDAEQFYNIEKTGIGKPNPQNEFYMMDYSKKVPLLYKAIQELNTILEDQAAQIEALKA